MVRSLLLVPLAPIDALGKRPRQLPGRGGSDPSQQRAGWRIGALEADISAGPTAPRRRVAGARAGVNGLGDIAASDFHDSFTHEGDESVHLVQTSRALLNAEEVAEILGMGVDWVYAQSRRGTIPTVRLGRYRRYRREAIDAWLAQHEQ